MMKYQLFLLKEAWATNNTNYNNSGYPDFTARTAIVRADKKMLAERKKRVMNKFYDIAAKEGLRIASYIRLEEMKGNKDE